MSWVIGADTDIPALRALLSDNSVAAVTIGQALHWMNRQELFPAIIPLVRPGGGVAVVTNGTPLWLQDTGWSRALRAYLEHWLGSELTFACAPTSKASGATRRTWPWPGLTCSPPPSITSPT